MLGTAFNITGVEGSLDGILWDCAHLHSCVRSCYTVWIFHNLFTPSSRLDGHLGSF